MVLRVRLNASSSALLSVQQLKMNSYGKQNNNKKNRKEILHTHVKETKIKEHCPMWYLRLEEKAHIMSQ